MAVLDSPMEVFIKGIPILDFLVALGGLKLLAIGGVLVELRTILQVVRVLQAIGFLAPSIFIFLPELSGCLARTSMEIVRFSSWLIVQVHHIINLAKVN